MRSRSQVSNAPSDIKQNDGSKMRGAEWKKDINGYSRVGPAMVAMMRTYEMMVEAKA